MAAPLSTMLADQVGTTLAGAAACLWPQILASAREHLVPWIDRNAPDLATPVRMAFQDLDIVADELRHAVRSAWRRLRTLLVGQTVQFVTTGEGEWTIQVISRLRNPVPGGTPVIELITQEGLRWEALPAEIRAGGLDGFRGTPIDVIRIRDRLLSDMT